MLTAHSSAARASTSAPSARSCCEAARARCSTRTRILSRPFGVLPKLVHGGGPFPIAERTEVPHAFRFVERRQNLLVPGMVLGVSALMNHQVSNLCASKNAKREQLRKPAQVHEEASVAWRVETAISVDQRFPMEDRQIGVLRIQPWGAGTSGHGKLGDHPRRLAGQEPV